MALRQIKMFNYFIFMLLFIFIHSCKEASVPYSTLSGETMGTYYTIKLQTPHPDSIQKSIDSILILFNQSLSTYIPESTISQFNSQDSVYCYTSSKDLYFKTVFEKSKEIHHITEGSFDPTIAPLVNYYGFGYKEKKPLKQSDTVIVMDLLKLLVFEEISLVETGPKICLFKPASNVTLDFSAIAKGYGVDIIADYLNSQDVQNYMIEIGGEIKTLGVNDKGKPWVIGINRPDDKAALTAIEVPLQVSNKSIATSGNYRNNYESEGHKFSHIIDPKTGMSYETDILSVTVIAEDCMTADALATAFMVMGLEKSLTLANNLPKIDAFFIFDVEGDGQFEYRSTDNFSKYYLDNEQK